MAGVRTIDTWARVLLLIQHLVRVRTIEKAKKEKLKNPSTEQLLDDGEKSESPTQQSETHEQSEVSVGSSADANGVTKVRSSPPSPPSPFTFFFLQNRSLN